LGGNMRLKALQELKYKEIPDTWIMLADEWSEEKRKEFTIKDNVSFGEWDWDRLANVWNVEELTEWCLDIPNFDFDEVEDVKEQNKKLSDRFIIPPFSVLDTRCGEWQDRKRYWLSIGIESELGRDSKSIKFSKMAEDLAWAGQKTGISIFDPVLCELVYRWFNVPNGKILDCFAGGSVRGIVAAKLGYEYLGNDLRSEQIEANRINAKEVLQDSEIYPTWTCGDSLHIDTIAKGYEADLLFSCPPYAGLEVYSDKKEDISNMPYKDFIAVYREIIRKSCSLLKDDRFAVFVVGDVRDKKGFYQNFVSDTIMAFWNCGVILYNEMILVNQIGNLPMRAGRYFASGRKVGKQHQNVLVFYKGNPKNIKSNYPELDLSYIENEIESE
ncbi:MAG TPA: chromosome partitioning protein ParB, partial [Paludibacteraceae bacterium]|nr:chromosome partitioning protein ParB [Paludibacteraceae bacterium]